MWSTLLMALVASGPSGAKAPSHVEGRGWVVEARVHGRVEPGKSATLYVAVGVREGFHLNDDYPLAFVPAPAPEVTFSKTRYEAADGIVTRSCPGDRPHTCAARLPVSFVLQGSGPRPVGGTASFGACDADRCVIEQVDVSASAAAGTRASSKRSRTTPSSATSAAH